MIYATGISSLFLFAAALFSYAMPADYAEDMWAQMMLALACGMGGVVMGGIWLAIWIAS